MNIKSVIVLGSLLVMSSCDKQYGSTPVVDAGLVGNWILTEMNCYPSGTPYTPGNVFLAGSNSLTLQYNPDGNYFMQQTVQGCVGTFPGTSHLIAGGLVQFTDLDAGYYMPQACSNSSEFFSQPVNFLYDESRYNLVLTATQFQSTCNFNAYGDTGMEFVFTTQN